MSVKVQLIRRLGQNNPGSVISRTTQEAEWLIANGYGTAVADEVADKPVAAPRARQGRATR